MLALDSFVILSVVKKICFGCAVCVCVLCVLNRGPCLSLIAVLVVIMHSSRCSSLAPNLYLGCRAVLAVVLLQQRGFFRYLAAPPQVGGPEAGRRVLGKTTVISRWYIQTRTAAWPRRQPDVVVRIATFAAAPRRLIHTRCVSLLCPIFCHSSGVDGGR